MPETTKAGGKFAVGEQRLTVLLMGLWRISREDRRWPLARDFTASVLPHLLSDCFSLFPAEKTEDSEVCFIGENLARVSGITRTALPLSRVPGNTLLGVAARSFAQALQGSPVHDRGEFEDRVGKRNLYRAILLPLANDRGEIAQVIGGTRCKAGPAAG